MGKNSATSSSSPHVRSKVQEGVDPFISCLSQGLFSFFSPFSSEEEKPTDIQPTAQESDRMNLLVGRWLVVSSFLFCLSILQLTGGS